MKAVRPSRVDARISSGRIECIALEINRIAMAERSRSRSAYGYHRAVTEDGQTVRVVVIVLVRRGYRYLMVRDDNRGGTWFPPAGAVERGEDMLGAATRVVQQASGSAPVLEGIVRVSHMPMLPGSSVGRLRFVVDGRLSTDVLSEKTATVPASYLLPVEIEKLELRDRSIAALISEHARGMPTAPLDLYRVGLA